MSRLIDADALAEKKFQERECNGLGEGPAYRQGWNDAIDAVMDNEPSAQPERMTNRQWVDFLSAQFDISRTSAKEMLHGMMRWKKRTTSKKCLMGERHESRPYQQTGRDRSAVAVSVRKSGELHFNY